MGKNIECAENHNKCFIPQKSSTKLRMLAKIASIAIASVLTFSGCSSARVEIEQMINTNNKTERFEETTEQETEDNVDKVTIDENINYEDEYSYLFQRLNTELDKKEFSEEVNKLFIDTFERLYNNYKTWQYGYRDLPNTVDYIENNLINIIKDIDGIDFYEKGSEEGELKLEEEGAFGWTECSEDNVLKIGIIAKKAKDAETEERFQDIENFYHEIIHCKQKNIIFYSNYFDGYEVFRPIFIEGGATFHMKFTNPLITEIRGAWSIANEEGNLMIDYNKENCLGYLVDLNAYEKMVYLVGNDIIDKVEKGEVPFSTIEQVISQKYGRELAEKLLKTMGQWYTEYNNNWQGDNVYKLSVELENLFLECIKKDINSSKTNEELEENIRVYKHYKEKNLPLALDDLGNNITKNVFEIDSIDKIISNKMLSLEER